MARRLHQGRAGDDGQDGQDDAEEGASSVADDPDVVSDEAILVWMQNGGAKGMDEHDEGIADEDGQVLLQEAGSDAENADGENE